MAFTSERVLSSNAAVADFGFKYTLGDRNVFSGTDVHKKIIKQKYSKKADLEETCQLYWKYLNDSMRDEVACDTGIEVIVEDFFVTVRRVILRTIAYEMIGGPVVDMYNSINDADFISDFMVFQDLVEDCTAKAAVCPAWLSSVMFLKDCEKKRLTIASKLAVAISRALDGNDSDTTSLGKWLLAVHDMRRLDDTKLYNLEEIADFALGLLFAAHKNPSIAAAQAVLYALEFDEQQANHSGGAVGGGENISSLMEDMCSEAAAVRRARAYSHEDRDTAASRFLESLDKCDTIERVVVETLRVTAHSIGAIRKVVVKEGWKVSVDDEQNPSRPAKQFVLPCGSYVGVSHIVPHRDHMRCRTVKVLLCIEVKYIADI
jgi:hypothetical protein